MAPYSSNQPLGQEILVDEREEKNGRPTVSFVLLVHEINGFGLKVDHQNSESFSSSNSNTLNRNLTHTWVDNF